ncbi:MAG: M20/M25/M40 family metallo-hydrolase [Rhodospirillaceae bacterium]
MKNITRIFAQAVIACGAFSGAASAQDAIAKNYGAAASRIIAEATSTQSAAGAWNRLAELTDKYPGRLSGSANLESALRWAEGEMKKDGLANVRIEKVMVPHWVRGAESANIVRPYPAPLVIATLGGSVGGDVEAEVLVVKSFEELDKRAAEAKGKIVLFNVAFDEKAEPLSVYKVVTTVRGTGASRAAAHGAVGALVRSVGPVGHRTPHTGGMRYDEKLPKIPAAAVSAEDAGKLQRMQDRGEKTIVRMSLGAQMLPDAESGNLIAEIKGREKPDEVVLISGHIDSWDIASGAMDDGGGCVAMWEALRVLKRLNLTPRRTIRVVLFTNEENGTRGGTAYRDSYKDQLAKHVLAMESDDGVLPIEGYDFAGTPKARETIAQIVKLLAPVGGTTLNDGFNGADITPMVTAAKIPAMSPDVDMKRYFYLHHTPADTVDKVDANEMARMTAAMATIAYVVADLPEALDRAP